MSYFVRNSTFLKRRSTLLGLGLLFMTCLGFYCFRIQQAPYKVAVRNFDKSRTIVDVSNINEATLLEVETGKPINLVSEPKYRLFIFFSPTDCPSCLDEFRVWESLSRSYERSRLQVVGILINTSLDESRSFMKALKPSFRLYLDNAKEIERTMGLPHDTPFKVVTGPDGKVVFADGPNFDSSKQKAFGDKVISILQSS
jgi:peroxiredoxin